MFRKALKPQIANKILFSDKVPTTFEDWVDQATQYNANYRMAMAFMGRPTAHPNGGRNWNSSAPRTQHDPNAMQIDAMSPEVRADHVRRGACFNCHKHGHLSRDCPEKKNRSNFQGNFGSNTNMNNTPKRWTPNELHTHIENKSISLPTTISIPNQNDSETVKTSALLNSGAGGKFIDQNYVQKLDLRPRKLKGPLAVYNVDGTLNKKGTILHYVDSTQLLTQLNSEYAHLPIQMYYLFSPTITIAKTNKKTTKTKTKQNKIKQNNFIYL
ncbi:hypothetical protein GALMADRAFT_1367594 [Galerina marginata CBS 339.88]|uniref:CCHC-type domain-containing protein n=1 Tax=Galerina marginata (strain CBS 339.88) TaxID=685588 RepID=A0A067S3E2_GALM3|nr:hypothetical protein GALMADRAFT_1367594 [Galerina marginata CBS 339.88]